MSRRLNLLIVALLIAVVPVRGFAATMMAGMGIHGSAVGHEMHHGVTGGATAGDAAVDAAEHCLDHAAAADAPSPVADGHRGHDVSQGHHGTHDDAGGADHAATCTICSACCTAGALTPPAWRAPVVRATVAPAIGPDDLIAGIILPRLDRPPLAA